MCRNWLSATGCCSPGFDWLLQGVAYNGPLWLRPVRLAGPVNMLLFPSLCTVVAVTNSSSVCRNARSRPGGLLGFC